MLHRTLLRTAPTLALLALACTSPAPERAVQQAPPATPTAPLAVPAAAAADGGAPGSVGPVLPGDYLGAPCGLRNHPRRFTLAADGALGVEDRISPCPPDAVCVWSGIDRYAGRWQASADGGVQIEYAVRDPAARLPERLDAAPGGALADAAGCRYEPEPPPSAEPLPAPAVEPGAEPEPAATVEPVAEPEPATAVEPGAEPEPLPATVEPVAEPEPAAGVEPAAESAPDAPAEPALEALPPAPPAPPALDAD